MFVGLKIRFAYLNLLNDIPFNLQSRSRAAVIMGSLAWEPGYKRGRKARGHLSFLARTTAGVALSFSFYPPTLPLPQKFSKIPTEQANT